jgi:hypothetical protein
MEMNRILVAHEKHGDRYFDASTDELLDAAAIFLLADRHNDGYWYPKPERGESKDWYNQMKKVVDAHTNKKPCPKGLAWSLLCQHSDGEYESVSLEDVEELK